MAFKFCKDLYAFNFIRTIVVHIYCRVVKTFMHFFIITIVVYGIVVIVIIIMST